MTYPKEVVVFFAWQSDLPDKTNRRAIRNALRAASSRLEEEFSGQGLRLVLEEATRDEPGSPNIPQQIINKINASDIFVCDLTTINRDAADGFRRTPNPNVVFELGYAVAQLGWSRIIMLFNTAFGDFPDDLPFDIDRHRTSPYKIEETSSTGKTSGQTELVLLLTTALKVVVEANPAKSADAKELNPGEVQRKRDVSNLRWLLQTIHWPTLDDHIMEGTYLVGAKVLHFWESFNSIVTNSLFHLYDQSLLQQVRNLHRLWGKSVSFGQYYHPAGNPNLYVFSNPGDMPLTPAQEKASQEIRAALEELHPAVDSFLRDLREGYLEIDIDELNQSAWRDYVNFEKEMTRQLESN